MWEDFKDKTYEEIFLSRDNIVIKVNREFLKLTGYGQGEILGKGLGEIERLLRIDSQVNLEDLEDELELNLFTKDLVPVEGRISSRTLKDGKERAFTFKGKINDCLSRKFKFADQLGTSRGDGVAVFNFPGLILINTNQNYLDFLEAPYNQKSVSLGKSLIEISIERWDSKLNDIRNYILETGKPYYDEEIGINSRGTKLYWNINLIPIFKEGELKYGLLSLSNVTEKVLNRKEIEQKNKKLKAVIENMSDEIIIFDKDLKIVTHNKRAKKNFSIGDSHSKNLNDMIKGSNAFDKDNKLIIDENIPFNRIARGEVISDYIMKINNPSEEMYREVTNSYYKSIKM